MFRDHYKIYKSEDFLIYDSLSRIAEIDVHILYFIKLKPVLTNTQQTKFLIPRLALTFEARFFVDAD